MPINIPSFRDLVKNYYVNSKKMYKEKRYDDSIRESISAIELALTHFLNEKISNKEKDNYSKRGLYFGDLIHHIEVEKLLYPSLNNDKMDNINHFRNMFAHSGTFISLLNETSSSSKEKKIEKIMLEKDVENPDLIDYAKNHEKEFAFTTALVEKETKVLDKFPDLRWASKEGTLKFINGHFDDFVTDMAKNLRVEDLKTKNNKLPNFGSRFHYFKFIADEVHNTSEVILKKTNFI